MAAFLFTRAILEGRPITLFNHGRMKRDFTYIDDVVPAVLSVLDAPPAGGGAVPHRIYNVGNNRPEALTDYVAALEQGDRPQGGDRACADAARRRGGDLGRHLGTATRPRLRAQDHNRRGNTRSSSPGTATTTASDRTLPALGLDAWSESVFDGLATGRDRGPPRMRRTSRARARGRATRRRRRVAPAGRAGRRAESKDYRLP